VTSLRKRFESGDFSESFLAFWHQHKSSTPLCCHDMQLFDYEGRPLKADDFNKFGKAKDSIWKIKCDMTEWMTIEDFKPFCLECQKEIEEILKRAKKT
jgi:hypothetical protein